MARPPSQLSRSPPRGPPSRGSPPLALPVADIPESEGGGRVALSVGQRFQLMDEYFYASAAAGRPLPVKTITQACGDKTAAGGETLAGFIQLLRRIGSKSANSEVYVGRAGKIALAVKKLPLDRDLAPGVPAWQPAIDGNTTSPLALGGLPWIELLLMEITRIMVRARVCPSLTITYDYMYCPDMTYVNADLKSRGKNHGLYVNMELASGDFDGWAGQRRTIDEARNVTFDLLTALWAVYRYTRVVHRDFHLYNILMFGPRKGSFPVDYTKVTAHLINGRTFYRPRGRHMALAYDWQWAFRPDVLQPSWVASIDKQNGRYTHDKEAYQVLDYWRFASDWSRKLVSQSDRDPELVKWIGFLKGYAVNDKLRMDVLILKMFPDWLKKPAGATVVEEFDMDQNLTIPAHLCALGIFLPSTTQSTACEKKVEAKLTHRSAIARDIERRLEQDIKDDAVAVAYIRRLRGKGAVGRAGGIAAFSAAVSSAGQLPRTSGAGKSRASDRSVGGGSSVGEGGGGASVVRSGAGSGGGRASGRGSGSDIGGGSGTRRSTPVSPGQARRSVVGGVGGGGRGSHVGSDRPSNRQSDRPSSQRPSVSPRSGARTSRVASSSPPRRNASDTRRIVHQQSI